MLPLIGRLAAAVSAGDALHRPAVTDWKISKRVSGNHVNLATWSVAETSWVSETQYTIRLWNCPIVQASLSSPHEEVHWPIEVTSHPPETSWSPSVCKRSTWSKPRVQQLHEIYEPSATQVHTKWISLRTQTIKLLLLSWETVGKWRSYCR